MLEFSFTYWRAFIGLITKSSIVGFSKAIISRGYQRSGCKTKFFKVLGFRIGAKIYVDDLGKDEVLEIRHNGQIIEAGTMLPKTSKLDLILGNGVRKQ